MDILVKIVYLMIYTIWHIDLPFQKYGILSTHFKRGAAIPSGWKSGSQQSTCIFLGIFYFPLFLLVASTSIMIRLQHTNHNDLSLSLK